MYGYNLTPERSSVTTRPAAAVTGTQHQQQQQRRPQRQRQQQRQEQQRRQRKRERLATTTATTPLATTMNTITTTTRSEGDDTIRATAAATTQHCKKTNHDGDDDTDEARTAREKPLCSQTQRDLEVSATASPSRGNGGATDRSRKHTIRPNADRADTIAGSVPSDSMRSAYWAAPFLPNLPRNSCMVSSWS